MILSFVYRNQIFEPRLQRFPPVSREIIERLRNENEDKTKTQMTQTLNQYSGNETKIWRQNILNQFDRVYSSCLCSHFVISLSAWLNYNAMFYKTFICFYVSEAKPLCFSLYSQMFDDVGRC